MEQKQKKKKNEERAYYGCVITAQPNDLARITGFKGKAQFNLLPELRQNVKKKEKKGKKNRDSVWKAQPPL